MNKSFNYVKKNCIPGEGEILFLEPKNTITYTKQYGKRHLLVNTNILTKHNINLVEADRGGDITFHGKGQLVGYPIIKLPKLKNCTHKYEVDIGSYINKLENALLLSSRKLGIKNAITIDQYRGIWIKTNNEFYKFISLGIGIAKGITRHGFAINININYNKFLKYIIPCGLKNMKIINISEILHNIKLKVSLKYICNTITKYINNVFT